MPASGAMSPRAWPLVPWQLAQVAARLRARWASWASVAKDEKAPVSKMAGIQALIVSYLLGENDSKVPLARFQTQRDWPLTHLMSAFNSGH